MKLIASSLAVNRAGRRIVDDLSFSVERGQALIITGENGAGKSTLLRAIAGLLPLETGTLEFEGGDSEATIGEQIHYLGHHNAMKSALSVKENLEFWQNFIGEKNLSIEDVLEVVDLSHTLNVPFGYLSTGMKRRISIARLLLNKKPIWVVDEPTSGLDGHSSKMFTQMASDFCANGGILIAATHLPLNIKSSVFLEMQKLSSDASVDEFGDEI